MYLIADYDTRYKPLNKSGGELIKADYVKLPVKPKGDGLQILLEQKRGVEVFAVWCLLLEKTTAQKPETRGKLLNFKDEPATINEIAKSISLKGKEKLVEYAINLLVSMGWIISDGVAELSSEEFRERGAKLKVSKVKVKEKIKHLDFVSLTSEEYKKILQRYGDKNTRKLIGDLNRYIGQSGKQYKSHYYTLLNFAKRDNLPEIITSEEDDRADKLALEKKRQEIREEHSQYYREKTVGELRELRKYKPLITHWWLIDEILKDK